jgi:hypothetical protein
MCYPVDKKFTWRQTSPIKQDRIGYILVSEDIFSLMEYTKMRFFYTVGYGNTSDFQYFEKHLIIT